MNAVVLAAGLGKRMQPLTDETPKALIELKGKPLLQHVLESLQKAGVKETAIVIGYKGEKVRKKFGNSFGKMKLLYAVQQIPMGTAHALLQTEGKVKGKFLAASTDVIVEPKLWKKLAAKKGNNAVVALRQEQNPENFGVALVSKNRLLQIIEKPKGKIESNLVNAGAYCFSQKIFQALKATKVSSRGEFELTDTINALAANGKASFVAYKGKCLDIGTPEDLQKAEKA